MNTYQRQRREERIQAAFEALDEMSATIHGQDRVSGDDGCECERCQIADTCLRICQGKEVYVGRKGKNEPYGWACICDVDLPWAAFWLGLALVAETIVSGADHESR